MAGLCVSYRMPLTRKAGLRSYKIHDNGGRPFIVTVAPKRLSISVNHWDEDYAPPKHFKDYAYKQIWIGKDVLRVGPMWKPTWAGNSVLAQIEANRYLYIGSEIYEFSMITGDSPVTYNSYVGNNDVPYPFLIGKTHTYLMLEDVAIPNETLNPSEDPYIQYYGFRGGYEGVKEAAKRFRKKTVHKRLY